MTMHTMLFVAALLLALSAYIAGDERSSVAEQSARLHRSSTDGCLLVAGVFCAFLGSLT